MSGQYHNTERRRAFYKKMVEITGGKCMICHQEDRLVIDHNHKTGDFRGLLCYTHNAGLGMFQDNPELLEEAARYLRDKGHTSSYVEEETQNIHIIIQELIDTPSYHTDQERAEKLTSMFPLSLTAAKARISRHKNREKLKLRREAGLRRVRRPKNRPYNSNRMNGLEGQKIEVV